MSRNSFSKAGIASRIIGAWVLLGAAWVGGLDAAAAGLSNGQLRLENGAIRVELAADNGCLRVTDLRSGQVWNQALAIANPSLRQMVARSLPNGRSAELTCMLDGVRKNGKREGAPFRVSLRLSEGRPELVARFEAQVEGDWREAGYPYQFVKEGPEVYNLYPHSEGMLVPANKANPDWLELPGGPLYGGTRSLLMCLGLVDMASGAGLLTLLPNIESTHVSWREISTPGGQLLVAPQIFWWANKGRFDRPYEMAWNFSSQGGYVKMAERYRQFFAERGLHKTLAEKARENPAVLEMAGAPIFWAISPKPPEVRAMADLLKSKGIDRCLFALPVVFAPQSAWPNRQELMEVASHVRSLGYLTYRYDQYRDTFQKDPKKDAHHQLNTAAFPDQVVRAENQKMIQAFGPDSGVICPRSFMTLARANLPGEFKSFGYRAWFLDCLGSVEFNAEGECFDPRHPCDLFDTRRERENLCKYVNELGCLASSECGLDYLIPWSHWFEGATTLVNHIGDFPAGVAFDGVDPNARNWTRFSAILKEMGKLDPSQPTPLTISQSTRYRIPFYSLCHHDEVVVTWRWEDGMERPAAYWARKNLWCVLYGAPPMYRIYASDTRKYESQIGQTQRYVSDWVRTIAFDPMTNHRFLTPERDVQETTFANGRGVVVNFGGKPAKLADGQVVPAMDYVTFQLQKERRVYAAAPCANVFRSDK